MMLSLILLIYKLAEKFVSSSQKVAQLQTLLTINQINILLCLANQWTER